MQRFVASFSSDDEAEGASCDDASKPSAFGLGYRAEDVLHLAGGIESRLTSGHSLRQGGMLHAVDVSREGDGTIVLRGQCTGSTVGVTYTLEVRIASPPMPLLISRSCDCKHFVDTVRLTQPRAEGQQRLCKHLCALMLEALEPKSDAAAPAATEG